MRLCCPEIVIVHLQLLSLFFELAIMTQDISELRVLLLDELIRSQGVLKIADNAI